LGVAVVWAALAVGAAAEVMKGTAAVPRHAVVIIAAMMDLVRLVVSELIVLDLSYLRGGVSHSPYC
jgi:hypothetical protein